MLSPRWRKVLRDVWGSKLRTVLVVVSIAVGVFAVGTIATASIILERDLNAQYLGVHPSNATLFTAPFDDELVAAIRSMPGVGAAEGRRSVRAQVQIGPDQWQAIDLFALPDYHNIAVDMIQPQAGAWPPPDRELLIERASLPLANAAIGDTLTIELPNGKQRTVRVAGTTHDITRRPAIFGGALNGYITFSTLEWLGEDQRYDELRFTVATNAPDADHVKQVAADVRHKIERTGRSVNVYVPPPGKHPLDTEINTMLLILNVLGWLSLLLSGFLVVNTTSAILAQQVRQIGVMKAVGARPWQLVRLYAGMVALFGVLALVVAVPLGALGARSLAAFAAGMLNFDIGSLNVPPTVLALQIAVALVVPLVAALWPIWSGARITVREAIASTGIGSIARKRGVLDRLLERVRGLSRPLLLSLRNTFRRKGRLARTLMTLTLAGAIVVAVFSVRDSFLQTLDDALAYWRYDVEVNFNRAYRTEQIERLARQVPGVVATESWNFGGVRRVRPDGEESDRILMIALPAQTQMVQPTVLEGRWLLPDDENAVVINTDLRRDEPDVRVGDELTVTMNGDETTWRVVGLVQGVLAGPFAYTNAPYWQRSVGDVGRSGSVQIITTAHDAAMQQAVAVALRDQFEQHGLSVNNTNITSDTRKEAEAQFNVVIVFLLIMAALLAMVGGLGLMGTMSINVLERTREIGVLRAIGASTRAVLQIVIAEGVLIGVLSWVFGTVLALPLGKWMSDGIGNAFLRAPMSYVFSWNGALLWLGAVIVLATVASLLPARSAARLSVREVLAYE